MYFQLQSGGKDLEVLEELKEKFWESMRGL